MQALKAVVGSVVLSAMCNEKQLKCFRQKSNMILFEVETAICSSKSSCLFSLGTQPDPISCLSWLLAVHSTHGSAW